MFFHALTFAGSRGSCLNMRSLGRMLKHLPRGLANVNALKCNAVDVNKNQDKNAYSGAALHCRLTLRKQSMPRLEDF